MEEFLEHVKNGLSQSQKKLSSRYFYDTNGDALFQQIMQLDEYYLPKCEMQIINNQSKDIATYIARTHQDLEIIELGAGDGSKTKHLIKQFQPAFESLAYTALDISENVLDINKDEVLMAIPNLDYRNKAGNYLDTYPNLERTKSARLILFLGGNIGNYLKDDAITFFNFVKANLQPNDYFLVAFDFVKHPRKIIKAYDDSKGVTKAFNLNLLERINRELGGNFDVSKFDHYPFYNPQSGVTASYIISLEDQDVRLSDGSTFHFKAFEAIHTEVSKKFFMEDIMAIAESSEFKVDQSYFDDKKEYAFILFKK